VQERSAQLVADILEAAIRVLEREGAQRFTTIRVAEQAGVSVGSLYQYFPNKQAILFRLQVDEWRATAASLDAILGNTALPPAQRLRETMRAFFLSECDEAPLRLALDGVAASFRDSAESHEMRRRGRKIVDAFLAVAAPAADGKQRAFAADLLFTMMSGMGKAVSERGPQSHAAVHRWADAISDMLFAYLQALEPRN
jgi:AcrR family transcriptional regulator